MANELFYPHGMSFGGTFLGQADDINVDANIDELTMYAAGDYAPSFTGGKEVAPEFKLDTFDASGVFALVGSGVGGVDELCRAFSAGNVDTMFRQAKNLSVPNSPASNLHYIYRVINGAMFYWDGFKVNNKGEVQVMTKTIATLVSGNPIVTQLPNQTISTPQLVTKVYTLGKIVIDGTAITRLKSCNWSNGVKLEKETADGEASPTFCGIEQIKPTVQFDTQNLAVINAFGFSGYKITSTFDVYLRKRAISGINVPDATAEHIRIRATAGTVQFQSTGGGKATGKCRVLLQRPSAGTKIWTITDGVAIP